MSAAELPAQSRPDLLCYRTDPDLGHCCLSASSRATMGLIVSAAHTCTRLAGAPLDPLLSGHRASSREASDLAALQERCLEGTVRNPTASCSDAGSDFWRSGAPNRAAVQVEAGGRAGQVQAEVHRHRQRHTHIPCAWLRLHLCLRRGVAAGAPLLSDRAWKVKLASSCNYEKYLRVTPAYKHFNHFWRTCSGAGQQLLHP